MRNSFRFFGPALTLSASVATLLSGCTVFPTLNASRPGNRAVITELKNEQGRQGLRLAVKDNIDMAGIVTTAGSRYFATHHPPAAKDAPCLALARERGVRIVAKTNLSEFAIAPSGLNDYYGTPRNPFCFWNRKIPGGSSSGSAVVVAANVADVAFGTDTAGSIRVPAACCGIVGLKTTHGLVPIEGVVPIEPEHLDTVGPMGRDIASTVVGMDLLERGFAARYAAARSAHPTAASLRIGRLRVKGTDPRMDASIDAALARTGFQVIPLDESFAEKWEEAKRDGNVVAASGAWISGQKYRFSPGVSLRSKVVILNGQINYTTKYRGAIARRAAWQAELARVFQQVDFIALPTLQKPPFNKPFTPDVGLLEAQMLQLQNTVPVNYAGNPALALPVPLKGSAFALASLQLIGPPRSEAGLLAAGRLTENAVNRSNRGTSYERLAKACATSEQVLRQ